MAAFLRVHGLKLLSQASLFIAVCILTGLLIKAIPKTDWFWTVVQGHFKQDAKYQLQGLFLPDQARNIPYLIIGDTTFHSLLPKELPSDQSISSVVSNSYDADDVGAIFKGLKDGHKFTQTQVCSVVLQVTPLFIVRSKALGYLQDFKSIRYVYKKTSTKNTWRQSYEIFKRVAKVRKTLPKPDADPLRPIRMVGQARFADSTLENWNIAFSELEKFKRPVIAVFDSTGTDWGEDTDLVSTTRAQLDILAASVENFSWVDLADFKSALVPTCEEK
jgi:hypothetical protein